jgi:hypothetical protein
MGVSPTICEGLSSNLNPPNLCLLSSYDYRHEPLVPGHGFIFIFGSYLFVCFETGSYYVAQAGLYLQFSCLSLLSVDYRYVLEHLAYKFMLFIHL